MLFLTYGYVSVCTIPIQLNKSINCFCSQICFRCCMSFWWLYLKMPLYISLVYKMRFQVLSDMVLHIFLIIFYFFSLKGATKSYFTHYSYVVIVFFNKSLCKSAFSNILFEKAAFMSFCAFCFLCFESNILNEDIIICVIMLYNFAM